MGDIIELAGDYLARCPECHEHEWNILVDKPGDFTVIKGIECANCEMTIDFEMQVVGRR